MVTGGTRVTLVAVALTLLAIPWRFINLESLSFYGDEETSALPARSLARGDGPRLPTGIEYRRAIPLTVMNALSAKAVGEDREISYRLPAAVLGTLTVPTLYLVGQTFVGGPAAALGAAMLALSEWHLVFSRQSRMYAPFLLFYILAAWAAWRWAYGDPSKRRLLLAGIAYPAAPAFHAFGLLAPMFPLLPLAFVRKQHHAPWKMIAFAVVATILGYVYIKFYVMAAYTLPTYPPNPAPLPAEGIPQPLPVESQGWFTAWNVLRTLVGAGLGLWLAARSAPNDPYRGASIRHVMRFGICATAGALLCLGHLYGAALGALVFLLLQPDPRNELLTRIWVPATVLTVIAAGETLFAVQQTGVVEGIKSLSRFPFPYPAFLAGISPGVVILFVGTAVWLAASPRRQRDDGVRACVLATVVPLAGLGVVSEWGASRYLLPVYPFLLLTAAFGLTSLCTRIARRAGSRAAWLSAAAAAALVGSGVLGGHGIPQAVHVITLRHGEPVNAQIHMFPLRPDHKGPGELLRRTRAPGDVIIAEDPLQQYWYAGSPIDYWLRSYQDSRKFVYQASDGRIRDIYVNSELVVNPARIDSMTQSLGRVWLVTSGETYAERTHYLDVRQRTWLDSLEAHRSPVHTGLDGVTKVYCLNCPSDTPD